MQDLGRNVWGSGRGSARGLSWSISSTFVIRESVSKSRYSELIAAVDIDTV